MKIPRKIIFLKIVLFTLAVVLLCSISCKSERKQDAYHVFSSPGFSSYRDIPGVTDEEIEAIEELRNQYGSFVYGMGMSTEAFYGTNGEVEGYIAIICRWLTQLFEIEFTPAIISTWPGLLDGLDGGGIDFTGDLTANDERRQIYFMTDPIAYRPLKYLRIAGSEPLAEIAKTRLPRYILVEKTTTANDVLYYAIEDFEPVYVTEFSEIYGLLKTGRADALITEGSAEAYYDHFGDVVTTDFLPLIFSPVSLSTRNPRLWPIISVVQKALENGAGSFLLELYDQGYQEYKKHKLYTRLTEEEIEYIKNNPVINFGAEFDNYPVSFFNLRHKEWQGISIDVLKEIETLTGLSFHIANNERTNFTELLDMLESGKISILSEVFFTPDREERFLWPQNSYMEDHSVLVSRADHPNININRIYSVRVGVSRGTVSEELFKRWFPNHPNVTVFDNMDLNFNALINGDIDMVLCGNNTFLYLTNYMEQSEFKSNIVFDNSLVSTFGFNKDEKVLCSIVDKSLALIDTSTISRQWLGRTYDYRLRLAQAQIPWIRSVTVLSLLLLLFLTVAYLLNRRKRKTIERQSAMLATIYNAIPAGLFLEDVNGFYVKCNHKFEEMMGVVESSIIGKTPLDMELYGKELARNHVETDKKVIKEKITAVNEETYIYPDESYIFVEVTKIPLIQDDKVTGILGIVTDITERKMVFNYAYSKQLNNALAKITKSPTISTGDLYDAAAVIAKEGCIALNTHRVGIWSTNEDAESLQSIVCYDICAEKHFIQCEFDLTTRKEYAKLLRSERLIVTNDIKKSEVLSSLVDAYAPNVCAVLDAPIRIGGKLVGVVCIEQDRCEEYPDKREWTIEEQNFSSSLADLMALAISCAQRYAASVAAETANRAKSTFLANMSHEIRTPMNAIMGITEIMLQNDMLPDKIDEGLDRIYNSGNNLLGIINDILDLSKIETGKLELHPAEYDVPSLINDTVQLNIVRIGSKPIEFILEIDENLPLRLYGDELRLKQILNNLLSNAIKYTEKGYVKLSVKHLVQENDAMLCFAVEDTGQGLKNEDKARLFSEYQRFNIETNRATEGTGIGLNIAKKLIEMMDGRIEVESEYGKGSKFTVTVRQKIVRLQRDVRLQEGTEYEPIGAEIAKKLNTFSFISNKTEKHNLVRNPMPYGKVLIVDDVETNLFVAEGLLNLYKIKTETALSGFEAIKMIEALQSNGGKTYDIIFMDHMMPQMDGIETTRKLRESGYKGVIVALTANALVGNDEMFKQNDFDGFITKPIDMWQMDKVLNEYIHDRYPEEAKKHKGELAEQVKTPSENIKFIKVFCNDAKKTCVTLRETLENGDSSLFATTVHSMRAALKYIGEDEMAELAFSLETAAQNGDKEFVAANSRLFIETLSAIAEKLGMENMENTAEETAADITEDTAFLKKQVLIIKTACENYDDTAAYAALDRLKEKGWKPETKAALESIHDLLFLDSDFEKAQALASKIISLEEKT